MTDEQVEVYIDLSGSARFSGSVKMSRSDAKRVLKMIDRGDPLSMESAADMVGAFRYGDIEWRGCDDFRINGEIQE